VSTPKERLATFVEAVGIYSATIGQKLVAEGGVNETDMALYVKSLSEAALAYARPIVAEECARIAKQVWEESTKDDVPYSLDGDIGYFIDKAAAAIREHGRAL